MKKNLEVSTGMDKQEARFKDPVLQSISQEEKKYLTYDMEQELNYYFIKNGGAKWFSLFL